ncbi:MAG TPA: cysteine--tRNA ligase, partial [Candidatus Desulfaltia sp.]|nr:cysteine--tRNA ligase [Candidatus Desulfaltia sp.]
MIKFFNTMTGRKETFTSVAPGAVKIYTCGPTVYDFAHVGNFRAYLFEDLLKRFLLFMGYHVTHIMNITDIDDKTIRGANARGVSLAEYTRDYIDSFFADLKTLNIAPADRYPRATEHIPEMVAIVKGLIQKGFAYEKDGSYYFSIAKFPSYGRLSKINREELQPGRRVDLDEYEKESVHDFALWKAKKEGEPFWETEIGPGRPGWHIECSAMSSKYLGETFDIHCGGVDNIFPHHENEIAQSEAFTGKKFVNYWLHCHHLIRDGEKMSKSRGNTITIPEILKAKNNPAALRFLLLSTHYRKTLNFTFEALDQAETALNRINEFAGEVKYGEFPEGEIQAVGQIIKEAEKKFRDGLSDDLNISVAVTALFNLIKKVNVAIARGDFRSQDAQKADRFMSSINQVLGVTSPRKSVTVRVDPLSAKFSVPPQRVIVTDEITAQQKGKIERRQKARAEKDFALADKIRRELLEDGIVLEDTKDGVRWKIVPV